MSSLDRTFNEKRDFIRMKINSPVSIRHNGADYQGICKDLSGAGMLISTENAFKLGDEIEISIEPNGDNHMPFKATADVSRVDADGENYIVGLSIKQIL